MDNRYFRMSTSIIDRQDLSIYEKMCAAVLSRYVGREEFDNLITLEVIAMKMGVNTDLAEKAIQSLIDKKLLSDEYMNIRDFTPEEFTETPKKSPSKKTTSTKSLQDSQPSSERSSSPKAKSDSNSTNSEIPQDDLIQAVYGIIKEKVNSREARIILNFANNDIELIREKYKVVKNSQIGDKVELLMAELQKKPKAAPKKSNVIKAEDLEVFHSDEKSDSPNPSKGFDLQVGDTPLSTESPIPEKAVNLSQVNINKIQKMKAYQDASNMRKNKD